MASASFLSVNGPTCTWNKGSPACVSDEDRILVFAQRRNQDFSVFLFDTAATCTIKKLPRRFYHQWPPIALRFDLVSYCQMIVEGEVC